MQIQKVFLFLFFFFEKTESRIKHLHNYKFFKTTKGRQEEKDSIKQRTPLLQIYF